MTFAKLFWGRELRNPHAVTDIRPHTLFRMRFCRLGDLASITLPSGRPRRLIDELGASGKVLYAGIF